MYSARCQVDAMAALLQHSAECLGKEDDCAKWLTKLPSTWQ
jgi:hypothetical protein